tara:strand:- start:7291 stop:7602 length:312 start_codon:yes stop_codon:yes gene_type:complete
MAKKKAVKTFEYEDEMETQEPEIDEVTIEEVGDGARIVSEAKAKEYYGYTDEEFNDRSEFDKKRIRKEVYRLLEKEKQEREKEARSSDLDLDWGEVFVFNDYE